MLGFPSREFELDEKKQREMEKNSSAKKAKLDLLESGNPTVSSSDLTSKGKELHFKFTFETLQILH